MAILPLILMALGAFAVLALIAFAFAGPSPARAGARRLQLVRERHSSSAAAVVEARLRKITASRSTRMDDAVTRLLPRPALLKKRLAMTGKTWTVGQHGMGLLGITLVVGLLLWIQGRPALLGPCLVLFLGLSSEEGRVGEEEV